LAHKESVWVPTILHTPGDSTLEDVNKKGTTVWLAESWAYYRRILGRLETPADDYLAEFFEPKFMADTLRSLAGFRRRTFHFSVGQG